MEQEIVWKYWNAKKIVECQNISIKMKNFKIFDESQTTICLKEII